MFIEPKNFRRLNLGANCLDAFELMAIRHRPLVEVILLNVKLPRYSCQSCKMNESESEKKRNNEIISKAVFKLFTILSTWQPTKELMLEFNVYSPSESDHWFKNYYFGSKHEDAASESLRQSPESTASWHDPEHGWVNGVRVKPPPPLFAIMRLFPHCYFELLEMLPRVDAVTGFTVRRQCRRWLSPLMLQCFRKSLPRLERMVYEPWKQWNGPMGPACDYCT